MRSILNQTALSTAWLLFAACVNALAAEVAYIETPAGDAYTRVQMETATRFYGLDLVRTVITDSNDHFRTMTAIRNARTVAAVVTVDALPYLDRNQVLAGLRKAGGNTSLLITGITEQTDPALLRLWSAGAITNCKKSGIKRGASWYTIGQSSDVTRELGGSKLPLNQDEVVYLESDPTREARWLMSASPDGVDVPVFAAAGIGSSEVFFTTARVAVDVPVTPTPYREPSMFATLAPELLFLSHAAGERAWRSPGLYANLTIDDGWLREPYGHVNHEGLLLEMKRHNFHTTIAFVPWNFDRSEPAVVSLFRANGDRFSICVHGNNHDHREFDSYLTKPLAEQTEDVKQALARMAKFRELTQLTYDPVMVFPHAISPEKTLAVLKRYNFSATANFINVPLDSAAPSEPDFALRAATMAFSNFPSLRRYSVEGPIPKSQLAIDSFLGNPILFYAHQGFFASGMTAFNETADTVNRLHTAVQWQSLGYIAQHLYLEKLRDDGNYDVRAYTGTLHLDNRHARDTTFFIEKEEDFALPLTVLVDGESYPYQRVGKHLIMQVPVRQGMSREITIRYENDLNVAAIDTSKTSLRIHAIRQLSDFRDNWVSQTILGRRFIESYSENTSSWHRATFLAGLLGAVTAFWYFRRSKKLSLMSPNLSSTGSGGEHR